MRDIQRAIRKIIERFIVNKTPLTSALSAGNTTISLESSRRYQCEDEVVIFNKPSMDEKAEGEVHKIIDIPNRNSIVIDGPLIESYTKTNSFVEKMIGGTFLDGVYLGDPEVIMQFPAITIAAKSKSNSWLTLESTTAEYAIDITVYTEATDHERAEDIMHAYADAIELGLFRSFYPLVKPFDRTTLVEPASVGDTIIKLEDEDMLLCGSSSWIWLESYDFLRFNAVKQSLGNGEYELLHGLTANFEKGDFVIRPRRHIYNSLPAQIQYGTVNKGTMLKAAVISYTAHEEIRRYVPYVDSLSI